jgi:hypothetical protein
MEKKTKEMEYVIAVSGGIEGLMFPDLMYVETNGVKSVRHHVGEKLLVHKIPATQFKTSLEKGSLGQAIKNGFVKIQPKSDEPVKVEPPKPAEQIQPTTTLLYKADGAQFYGVPPALAPVVAKPVESLFKDEKLSSDARLQDFIKMGHLDKLKWIKMCTDKALLTLLGENLKSKQLVNNIKRVLKKL